MSESTIKAPNLGRKIIRIRELKGMKQEALASLIGVSQQTISRIEQSEEIEEKRFNQIAKALGVTPDIIKNFNEENAIYNIQNTYDNAVNNNVNFQVLSP